MKNSKRNVRVEFVGDITSEYAYLEVFFNEGIDPFLKIGVSTNKELFFRFWATETDFELSVDDVEYLLEKAKSFLPKAIQNEEDYRNYYGI